MSYVCIIFFSLTTFFANFSYINCSNKNTMFYQKNSDVKNLSDVLKTVSYDKQINTTKENNNKEIMEIESRKKEEPDLLSRIIPAMVMPFMMSLMMLPMTLVSMKVMLMNSIFMGKLAIFLAIFAYLKKISSKGGGLYSHNLNIKQDAMDINKAHYGYTGGEEYGAYVNRRKRSRNS